MSAPRVAAPTPTPSAPPSQASTAPLTMPLPAGAAAAREAGLLLPWESIAGGWEGNTLTGQRLRQFVRPVALAVRDDYIYVVDAGVNQLLRYQRTTQRLEIVKELSSLGVMEVTDLYVAPDLSFYLADAGGRRVLHYDARGNLVQTFANSLNLTRPVAISVDDATRYVAVADGYYDHVLRFTPAGHLASSFGGRGEGQGEFLNITALAKTRDNWLVATRLGKERVQVLNEQGAYSYGMEPGTVIFPLAIAADEAGHAFVADYADNSIKIYERGKLLGRVGQNGVGPGQFKRIADMWWERDFLFVADSLNARIQVLRVVLKNVPPNRSEPPSVAP